MLFALLCGALSVCTQAATRRQYQSATVVRVYERETPSNSVGENPSDAPLQAEVYSYDIGIRLNCTIYTVRYDSAIDYLPPVFAPNNTVEVNPQKHVLYLSLAGNREVRMGIGGRSLVKDASCAVNN
jgi:hypothetical protein